MPSMRTWDTTPDSDYYNEMIPKVPVTRGLGVLCLEVLVTMALRAHVLMELKGWIYHPNSGTY